MRRALVLATLACLAAACGPPSPTPTPSPTPSSTVPSGGVELPHPMWEGGGVAVTVEIRDDLAPSEALEGALLSVTVQNETGEALWLPEATSLELHDPERDGGVVLTQRVPTQEELSGYHFEQPPQDSLALRLGVGETTLSGPPREVLFGKSYLSSDRVGALLPEAERSAATSLRVCLAVVPDAAVRQHAADQGYQIDDDAGTLPYFWHDGWWAEQAQLVCSDALPVRI